MTTVDDPRARPSSCSSASPAPASRPSPGGTSRRPQVLSSDAFRGHGRRRRERPVGLRPTRSTCCTTWPASGCAAGRLTVVDATNVQSHARAGLVKVAREHDVLPVAIVLDMPEAVCWERTQARPDRDFGRQVLTPPAPRPAPLARPAGPGGLPQGPRAARPRRDRRSRALREAVQRPHGADRPVRHHRRRARLPGRAGDAARPSWAGAGPRRAGTGVARTRTAAPRCSSATWSTAAPTRPACCAW